MLKRSFAVMIICLLFFVQYNVLACTGFTFSDGEKVLAAGNEDWYDYDFWVRVLPANNDRYGRVIIENHWPISPDPDWHCPQCGMNDQGLIYDCFATPRLVPVNSQNKPYYYDSSDHYQYSLESYILSVCSTVEEVLVVYDQYNLEHMGQYQAFWVDSTGASVIVEGDDVIMKDGEYQVVTNFYQSHPEIGGYPCWRYDTAVSMLEDMTDFSVEYFTSICDATHQTGRYPSVYSAVYDLSEKMMYLYHFYNYDHVVEIDVDEELSQGENVYFLADLFDSSDNQPPEKPSIPTGPSSGTIRSEYTYTSYTNDPNDDKIQFLFDWGDGTDSGWIQSTQGQGQASHSWTRSGDFEIRVKARDIYHDESEWSDPLPISMPKNKDIRIPFWINIFRYIEIFYQLGQNYFSL